MGFGWLDVSEGIIVCYSGGQHEIETELKFRNV